MKKIDIWLVLGLILAGLPQLTRAQSTWTFRVLVAVEPQTATYYQQAYGKPIEQIVREQIATINAHFNTASQFNATYNFRVDSIYVITRPIRDEVFGAHPGYHYKIVINGFSDNAIGGGWYGDYQTIYHGWRWENWDGPFGGYATDGLTHELAHARGAVDTYAMRVDADKNPVNGQAFEPVNSLMTYPYSNIVWDEYTTHLLNSTADGPITGDDWIVKPFPKTIAIKTLDQQGQPLEGVSLALYPVDWFSYTLTPTPVKRVATDLDGIYRFADNPYGVPTLGYPWHFRYGNFLLKASYNGVVAYQWLPVYDVQNAYFRYGADSTYYAQIQLPTTASMIRLTNLNPASLCTNGGYLAVTMALSSTFGVGNEFKLQLSDATGSFANPRTLAVVSGPMATTLSSWIGSPLTPSENYLLRVVSTMPVLESGTIPFMVKPQPDPPTVGWSLDACQNDAPPVLQAVGQNLLWYTSYTNYGEEGSPIAPVPNTSLAGYFTYYVTQTVNGCESNIRSQTVTIRRIYSIKSGPWHDPTVWSCHRVPIQADEPIISSNTTVFVSGVLALPKRVTFGQGAHLVFSAPN